MYTSIQRYGLCICPNLQSAAELYYLLLLCIIMQCNEFYRVGVTLVQNKGVVGVIGALALQLGYGESRQEEQERGETSQKGGKGHKTGRRVNRLTFS